MYVCMLLTVALPVQLSTYEKDKLALANSKARIKVQDEELASTKWQLEVLQVGAG